MSVHRKSGSLAASSGAVPNGEEQGMIEFIAGIVVGAVAVILWALRAAGRRNDGET